MIIEATDLQTLISALIAFILAIIAIFNKQRTDIVKNQQNAITTAPMAPAAPTAPAAPAGNWLAFKVTPTLLYGLKSPSTITFRLEGTQPQPDHPGIVAVTVNWDDGLSELITLTNGYAEVKHTFSFKPTDKYTGKTFNPMFMLHGSDGSSLPFNFDGISVEIGIEE